MPTNANKNLHQAKNAKEGQSLYPTGGYCKRIAAYAQIFKNKQ